MLEESPFSKIHRIQVGIIVRDIEKTIEYYESLGIGPFKPLPNLVYKSRTIRGKPIALDSIKLKIRVANVGPVQFELIEPGEDGELWREFLETRGEGIHHLGFIVDDIGRETARLEKKGLKTLYTSRYQNGGGAAYFDTDKTGGIIFELLQLPPK